MPKRMKLCTEMWWCASEITNYQAKLPFNYTCLQRAACCFLWPSVSNLYANLFVLCHSQCLCGGWDWHSSLPLHRNVKMRKAGRNFFIAHMSLPRYWIGPWFSDFNETGTQPRLSHCSEFRWFSFPAHILFSVTQESSLDCIQSCDRIILFMWKLFQLKMGVEMPSLICHSFHLGP